jgi:replicative DNA helicase
MQDFDRIAKTNLEKAKLKLTPKLRDLEFYPEKLTKNFIIENYNDYVNHMHGSELSVMIAGSPKNYQKIVKQFAAKKDSQTETTSLLQSVDKEIEKHNANIKSGKNEIKITHWEKLSEMIGGFNPGRIFVITAVSGLGKTNIATNIALSALNNFPVFYFNMEMITSDLMHRILMSRAELSRNQWNSDNFATGLEKLGKWYSAALNKGNDLLLTNGKSLTIQNIISEIIVQKEKNNLGLFVIDYDQKILTEGKFDQWKELHQAVEEIEEIAKLCEVPIILIAQADDDGKIKASKRIVQSATAHLDFRKENDKYILQAKKNRFGKHNAAIVINYFPDKSLCTEGEFYDEANEPRKNRTRGFGDNVQTDKRRPYAD